MKHKIVFGLILLLMVGAVGVGYWYFNQNPAALAQLQLKLGLISTDEASGIYRVSGYIEVDEVDVAAETKGRIRRLLVDEGDFVQTGQILAELDIALLEAEIEQVQAKIATAKARLAKVQVGVRAEEIAKAEAAVAVAQAKADAAYIRWQDTLTLRDNPQELDMQINVAKTVLELAELKIAHGAPLKDVGEAMWKLQEQQVTIVEDGLDINLEIPDGGDFSIPDNVDLREDLEGAEPGDEIRAHYEFKEGEKRQAWTNWNRATTDRWEAWVNLNSAVVERDEAETALNDLLRLRNDPQEAQIKVAQAEAAYHTALAEVAVGQARLDTLQVGPRAEQIALAEAQVQQAEASLAALKVQRDQHTLSSPSPSWVVERVAHEGELALPGVSLLTLADLNQLTLTVYVPEVDIDMVSVGQKIKVFVDTFPDQPFNGTITFISDKAEFTPKNVQTKAERVNTMFAVKIRLENEDQRLKPGMPADAILLEGPEL